MLDVDVASSDHQVKPAVAVDVRDLGARPVIDLDQRVLHFRSEARAGREPHADSLVLDSEQVGLAVAVEV